MNKKGQTEVFVAIIIVILLFVGFGVAMYFLWNTDINLNITQKNDSLIKVSRIIDGDTFELETGEKVRLICIDTPEKGEYYFDEATQYLRELIYEKNIILEKDINDKDQYGRLLRWVWVDGSLINEDIVKNGYGKYSKYLPDEKYCPAIEQAQIIAKTQEQGIWGIH